MNSSVSDHIVSVLLENEIDIVFGVPGGLVSPLYAALAKSSIRVITAKSECNAVWLAAGYAHATGKPALCLATSGPGVTNTITGMATALTERLPVILIGGEVPRSAFGRGALQETSSHTIDAVKMLGHVTKFSRQIVRPESAPGLLQRALVTAQSGVPGPVFLSLPVDVGCAPVHTSSVYGDVSVAFKVDAQACRRAYAALLGAKRPLIVAGAGARGASNRRALLSLAESCGAPVAVTPKGKGVFPERHPSYLGVFGFGGHESVTDYLKTAPDVVIVCGAGLNDFSTNAWAPIVEQTGTLIHVDIDAEKFGRSYRPNIGLLGNLADVVACMLPESGSSKQQRAADVRVRYQSVAKPRAGFLSSYDVIEALNELVPKDAILTVDMGEHLAFALHFLALHKDNEFFTCLGFGAMGSSLPVGIGMALASKPGGRRVYVLCGDGGALLSGTEIETAARLGAPVTVVLFNDARLNMCHHGMVDRYGVTNDFTTTEVDFARFAESLGVRGRRVRTRAELMRALHDQGSESGTEVLDIRIDPEVRLGGSQRTAALRQFTETPA